jgi:hypothetical protein
MKGIPPEVHTMLSRELISLSQQVQQLKANASRVFWNYQCQVPCTDEAHKSYKHRAVSELGTDMTAGLDDLQTCLEQMAIVCGPKKPSNL